MGNCDSVIGHGNLLIFGTGLPEFHFPVIEHTSATMDNHLVRRQIQREFCTCLLYTSDAADE